MWFFGPIRARLTFCNYSPVSKSSWSMLIAATGRCRCLQIWEREFAILKQSQLQHSWWVFLLNIYVLWDKIYSLINLYIYFFFFFKSYNGRRVEERFWEYNFLLFSFFSVYRAKVCISVFTFVCIMQFAMFETVISAVIDEFPKVLRKRRPVFGFFCHLLGFLLGIPMTMKVPFFCGEYVNITTIFTVLSRTMATKLLFFCVWYVNMTMKISFCCVRCTRWYPSFIYGV